MAEDLRSLIAGAVGHQPAGQLALAEQIPRILMSLTDDTARSQFLAFVHSWLPLGNRRALIAVATAFPSLVKAGDATSVGLILDCILSLDDNELRDLLESGTDSLDQNVLEGLISFLLRSQYDCSRVFACHLLVKLIDESVIFGKISEICRDKSFIVRDCLAKNSLQFSAPVSRSIAESLLKDSHPRVRGHLAHILVSSSFFFDYVAPSLADDADWSVRANLARAIAATGPPALTAPLALSLIDDAVFEVALCAIRALTSILRTHPEFEFPLPLDFSRLMRTRDLTRDSQNDAHVFCKHHPQGAPVRQAPLPAGGLRFAVRAGAAERDCAHRGRTRAALVFLFPTIAAFAPSAGALLIGLALRGLDDEAFAVRHDAAASLARLWGAEIPCELVALAGGRPPRGSSRSCERHQHSRATPHVAMRRTIVFRAPRIVDEV
jgi:hypothetical protein